MSDNDLSDVMKARLEKWRQSSKDQNKDKRPFFKPSPFVGRKEYGDLTETDLRLEEERAHG